MSRQDNLIIWHNANNIFLICNNFEQIYQYFIQSINELSKQEKELLIEKFN